MQSFKRYSGWYAQLSLGCKRCKHAELPVNFYEQF